MKTGKERGVKKMLLSHPFFRIPAGMTLEFLSEMVKFGAIAEFGYCTISPMWACVNLEFTKNIMDALSYPGQSHNPLPPEAAWLNAQGLYEKGVSSNDVETLIDRTPKALLGI